MAIAVFTGIDAGLVTPDQLDLLWNTYQLPVFQHFVGTDGLVMAAECEVHDGLHVREDNAYLEEIDGAIILTSLTDLRHPALRVRSGFRGEIRTEPCECGSTEPRIVRLDFGDAPEAQRAAA